MKLAMSSCADTEDHKISKPELIKQAVNKQTGEQYRLSVAHNIQIVYLKFQNH